MISEMAARNDLIVINQGRDFTFRRGAGGSTIYLTFGAPRLASRIVDWCVLQVITLSVHQCIEFSMRERSHLVNTGRGGKGRSPSWNRRQLSKDKLQKHLEETRLMDELGWAQFAGSLEDTLRAARRKMVAACDRSMPRRGHGRTGDSGSSGTTSCLSCVGNASQRGGHSPAQRVILCCARHGKKQNQL